MHVHGHGVHRQVPALKVLPQAAGEGDGGGVPVVGIVPVGAEGGDLAGRLSAADGHGAVPQSGGDGEVVKEGHGLLRQGRGGHVPVVGRFAHEDVPDAAAYDIRLVSGTLQRLQHRADLPWDHGIRLLSPVFRRI